MVSPLGLDDEKRALRQLMRQRRGALTTDQRIHLSHAVAARLIALPEIVAARVVAAVEALRSEVDLTVALQALASRGVAVAFPRVTEQAPRLRFHTVGGPADLVAGAFGVQEPASSCPEISIADLDVVVMPGLAFDQRGARLGYGGGYYDEVAARVRAGGRGFLVGVGFDFQLLERCPAGEGDVHIDCVVTDAQVVRCNFS